MLVALGRLKVLAYPALMALTALIYSLLLVLAFEPTGPLLGSLATLFLPWRALDQVPPDLGLAERMYLMHALLEQAREVAATSFAGMLLSLGFLGAFLARAVQIKRRRSEENRLLLLKNREIARRNEFIRHISATIGHEFKNNLARIKRRLELTPDIPSEYRERISLNFEKLFSDIDVFKRIADEREAGLIDFEPVNLRSLLEGLSREHQDFVEVSLGGIETPPTIYASRPLLNAVFENLFDNAAKYRKPEQPRALLQLTISLLEDGDRRYVSLSFRDEGIGMDEESADHCFYVRKESKEGWGEGLYFSKYVIGLHAGKIRIGKAHTAPGVGTEVIIHLPYVEESLDV